MAEFIVAIELGSTKITGIAGKKNLDGSITVLAVVREDSTQCIRKGVVYNIDKTVQCLTNIVTKLKTTLKTDIAHVYVGVGGQCAQCYCERSPRRYHCFAGNGQSVNGCQPYDELSRP